CDYRNRNPRRDGGQQLQIVAVLRAVAVHRSDEQFARAARLSLHGPLDGVASRGFAAAVRVDLPFTGSVAPRVNGDHDTLRTELLTTTRDQLGISNGRRVE